MAQDVAANQTQLIKDEMMFWFKQELRRRDQIASELVLKSENGLRDQKFKLEQDHATNIDIIKRQLSSEIDSERNRAKNLESKLSTIEEERNTLKMELSKFMCPREDTESQTTIINQSDAMLQTESDDLIKSLEEAATTLKKELENVKASEQQILIENSKLSKNVNEKESEVKFLQDLLFQEKEQAQQKIEKITSEYEIKLDNLSKRHEAVLGIQNLHLSEAIKERDNTLAKCHQLESEVHSLNQKLALELQSRALSDDYVRAQHEKEITEIKSRFEDDNKKSNQKVAILNSELDMVRGELNQARMECESISKKEQKLQLQIQEIKTRAEAQLLQSNFEVDGLKKASQRQSRRIAQLNVLLKQTGIDLPDHESSCGEQTQSQPKEPNPKEARRLQSSARPPNSTVKKKQLTTQRRVR